MGNHANPVDTTRTPLAYLVTVIDVLFNLAVVITIGFLIGCLFSAQPTMNLTTSNPTPNVAPTAP